MHGTTRILAVALTAVLGGASLALAADRAATSGDATPQAGMEAGKAGPGAMGGGMMGGGMMGGGMMSRPGATGSQPSHEMMMRHHHGAQTGEAGHHGMMGGMMQGGMPMMAMCREMMSGGAMRGESASGAAARRGFPRLPPGNEKLQLQMEAEMMQKNGEILARYAAKLGEPSIAR